MISLRRVPVLWRRWDVTILDLSLGLFFLVQSFLPVFARHGTQLGGVPPRPFDGVTVLAVALECLPLAVRRRRPVLCLALVSLGFAVDQLRGYHLVAGTALLVALVNAGCFVERRRHATALLFSVAYAVLAVALSRLGSGEPASEFLMCYLIMAFGWCAGAWLRSFRAAEAERRRRVAEEARAAERRRMARELHDVVTHHVTAMVVQAEAARYLTAAPDRLDQALTAVSGTGRQAIGDLRHLLDLLDPGYRAGGTETAGPGTPPAGKLLVLVEQTRRAGQPVEFTEQGTPPEPAGSAGLVAYRVVQESLTNALKYAHGSRTSVRVRHGEQEITVEVSTDESGSRAASPGGSGRGLAGLRERVGVLGGDFSAHPRTGGGFVVRARIPAGNPS
ncbi:sensor histidine kinase [Streptomyces sp. NPDC017082]|uniref:sensor histidine kinase n=1 Tax=Streptomyces sp. NPDC017082 TaxID=3364974 RepID=UPI003791DE11